MEEVNGQGAGSLEGGSGGLPEGSAPSVPDWGAFKEGLGDMGKDKSLEPIKDFHGLTKSYIEAQKMIGGSIRLPPKDGKPEDVAKAKSDIIGKLRTAGVLEAVPESPDSYDIKTPTVDGWTANEPLIASFKEAAHKHGISNANAQALFDWYINFQESSEAQSRAEFETMKADMKKEYGGLYTRRMEAARRAVAKYIGEDGDELISSLPPAIGRKLVKAFSEIGDPLLEDALIQGEKLGVSSVSDVEKKISDIVGNKSHPLWDLSSPAHNEAVKEWTALQQVYIQLKGKG